MNSSKMIEVIFVVFSLLAGANVVSSLPPSDAEPVVLYDDSFARILLELGDFLAQSVDLILVGTSDYPPIEQDVTFWCTKPNSTEFTQVLLNDPNLADSFDLTKPLAFIVHGWTSSFRGGFIYNFTQTNGWMELLATDFGYFTETNVCCLDWSRLALYEYTLCVNVNLPLVVSYFTEFVSQLLQLQITTANKLTIIGHSLGAHIAGRAGGNLNGTIKTIYGLDAAGPLFTLPLLTDISFRLDPTDAQYVQALHTNALILGSAVNLGHTDIYANGGSLQPGCLLPLFTMVSPFGPVSGICDHYASVAYFTTSCNPKFKFITTSSISAGPLVDVVQPVVQIIDTLLGEGNRFPPPAFVNNPVNVHDLLGPFGRGIHGQFDLTTQKRYPYTTNVSS